MIARANGVRGNPIVGRMFVHLKQMSTANDNEVTRNLKMFPEYVSAIEFESVGQNIKALPLFERVYDIAKTAMGISSTMASHTNRKIAENLSIIGNHDKAISVLSNENFSVTDNIRNYQLISKANLMKGNSTDALIAAEKATNLCENQSNDEKDIELLSACYSSIGTITLWRITLCILLVRSTD